MRRRPAHEAVYKFLDSQSRSVATYDTNPLWSVASGPWRLKSMDTAGNVQMVPNPEYGGPVKPTLKVFRELAFTQANDELKQTQSSFYGRQHLRGFRLPFLPKKPSKTLH